LLCETDIEIADKLPLALLGLRATVSTVTKLSPFEAVFGKKMSLPFPGCDAGTERLANLRIPERTYLEYVQEQLTDLENRVKMNITENKADMKRAYDKRFKTKPVDFKLGDLVWLKGRGVRAHDPCVITKRKFEGPHYITSIAPGRGGEGPAYFLTHSVTGRRLKHPVPPHRLKPCNTDRTELKVKYPNLDPRDRQPPTPSGSASNSNSHPAQPDGPDTRQQSLTDSTPSTDTANMQRDTPTQARTRATPIVYCPAKAITRQRH
jgi:hypothetical protein